MSAARSPLALVLENLVRVLERVAESRNVAAPVGSDIFRRRILPQMGASLPAASLVLEEYSSTRDVLEACTTFGKVDGRERSRSSLAERAELGKPEDVLATSFSCEFASVLSRRRRMSCLETFLKSEEVRSVS